MKANFEIPSQYRLMWSCKSTVKIIGIYRTNMPIFGHLRNNSLQLWKKCEWINGKWDIDLLYQVSQVYQKNFQNRQRLPNIRSENTLPINALFPDTICLFFGHPIPIFRTLRFCPVRIGNTTLNCCLLLWYSLWSPLSIKTKIMKIGQGVT